MCLNIPQDIIDLTSQYSQDEFVIECPANTIEPNPFKQPSYSMTSFPFWNNPKID